MLFLITAPVSEHESVILDATYDMQESIDNLEKMGKNVECFSSVATQSQKLVVEFCNIVDAPYPLINGGFHG